jgi:hypothetical protein
LLLAGALKFSMVRRRCRREGGKDASMWVFDGEEWKEEGGREKEVRTEVTLPAFDQMQPELQIVEIPVTVPRTNYIPVPLP